MKKNGKFYQLASELYAAHGVDTEKALAALSAVEIGIHAWQGDDVTGFEQSGNALTGGCQVTGNYPGCARTAAELMAVMRAECSPARASSSTECTILSRYICSSFSSRESRSGSKR